MKKKMIAAVSVAALAAGFANAEVKISNNFRIRPVFAEWNFTEADTYSRFSDLDSIQGASDTLTLEAKADYAGVKLVYNNNLTKDSVGFDSYNGWLKFGGLTFTGGLYDSRVANRVTADQNNLSLIEQNWGALYPTAKYDKKTDSFTFNKHNNKFIGQKKLGINANIGALRGVDSDNITALEGTKALSFVADYVISDVGDGKVQIWGAFNKASKEWTDTDHEVDSGYAFRAAYLTDDYSADADLHIRKDTIIAAAFFSLTQKNQIVEGLQATLGFTFAKYDGGVNVAKDNDVKIGGTTVVAKANNTAEEGITYGVDNTYWAIDARARYQIDESLSAGIYTNLTHVKEEATYGGTTYDLKDTGKNGLVWDTVLNGTYKLDDIITLFGEVEFAADFREYADKAFNGHQLAVQAGGLFTAGKGAEIDAAVRFTMAGLGNDLDNNTLGKQLSLPCCMRIKL